MIVKTVFKIQRREKLLKRVGFFLFLVIILIFTMPVLLMKSCEVEEIEKTEEIGAAMLRVYDVQAGKIVKMELEEYILGVIAAEMPSSFHIEALKAQALAARTYTVARMRCFGGKGCINHEGADICTDSTHCQAFIYPSQIKKDRDKYEKAVSETKGEIIVYGGLPIDAVFHSTSGGKTENCEDFWPNKLPYLKSVLSEFEDESPKLITKKDIPVNEFISCIKKLDSSISISNRNLASQINVLKRSDGGRIMDIKIGNREFKGRDVQRVLGLNSSNFSYKCTNSTINFVIIGNGHGIGLSQYGAHGMAKNGYKYDEIVKHYYSGVNIKKID